ncbi:DUF4280 domain-containing protein [Cellulophaga baltica]|uniref:DUF4280 domain-containing protein n=1 Tax=Cellulophaga baltica TaxID=76594 RepID=UPI00041562CC|nr:DUF4280 domain-containing protein [Cellulophaga baltica]AIY14025.1 hypothetical protein M667_12890 [Cellulophaga baltica NN016038]
MSGKKYVPEGVYLVCDKGAKPSELKILYYEETFIYGEKIATSADKIFIANFDPFGACACANGSPCTAPVTDWTNVTDGITLNGNDLLLEDSELPCTLGGNIKIFFSLAAATASLPKPKKGFWASALDTLMEVDQAIGDFSWGVAKGLWKGLKGTVTGVADLVVWAGKHHPIYIMTNPQGYADQLKKDKETLKAIGNVAAKAGKWAYRNSAVNMLTDPNDYMAAQEENSVMMDKMLDKAANMSAEEWGEVTGQIFFEVGLEVATAGAAAALTAVKAADRSLDVIKTLNALENASDGAKVLENADDFIDAGRRLETIQDGTKVPMPEELGDVKYLQEVADPPGTFRDSNGKLRNEDGTFAKDAKGKAKNKNSEYNRNMSERRKALLRDANDLDNDLSDRARKQILDSDGKKVPKGHEVSHEKPLYNAKTPEGKKALDIESNMKTQQKQQHRKRHKVCGDQYHEFGPANKPNFYYDDIDF